MYTTTSGTSSGTKMYTWLLGKREKMCMAVNVLILNFKKYKCTNMSIKIKIGNRHLIIYYNIFYD